MPTDPKIDWIGSPNFRKDITAKRGVVFHWIVGYLASADARFVRAGQTATQYAVGPNAIHQYVEDRYRAPGTGQNFANLNYISIEHEAGYQVNGTYFPGSPEMLERSAQLVAMLSRRHGWGKMVAGVNAFEHNDFVSTMCPGTLPWHWIIDRANEINGLTDGAPTNPGTLAPAGTVSYPVGTYNSYDIKTIQIHVGAAQDGVYGPETEAKVKVWQEAHGLEPDGVVGPLTWQSFTGQAPAPVAPVVTVPVPPFPLPAGWYFGPKTGPRESVSGFHGNGEHLATWQQQMKARGWVIDVDGRYGNQTAQVAHDFQAEKGLKADSLIGKDTWAAAWNTPIT